MSVSSLISDFVDSTDFIPEKDDEEDVIRGEEVIEDSSSSSFFSRIPPCNNLLSFFPPTAPDLVAPLRDALLLEDKVEEDVAWGREGSEGFCLLLPLRAMR